MSVSETLESRLREGLEPLHLEVVNESHRHNVPRGSETHFKVVVVAGVFDGKPQVQRHRMVYRLLSEELRAGLHALALHTYSAGDWSAAGHGAPASPLCRGGKRVEGG
jgi:BolA protein